MSLDPVFFLLFVLPFRRVSFSSCKKEENKYDVWGLFFSSGDAREKNGVFVEILFVGGKSPGRVLPPSTSSGGKDARICLLVLLLAFASSI